MNNSLKRSARNSVNSDRFKVGPVAKATVAAFNCGNCLDRFPSEAVLFSLLVFVAANAAGSFRFGENSSERFFLQNKLPEMFPA